MRPEFPSPAQGMIFSQAIQSLQYIYLLTVVFYKHFPDTDKVKFFFRLAPKSQPNQWFWEPDKS